jgi:hypothetical protein
VTEHRNHDLAETLPKLRDRISKARTRKEGIGEQNTKAALIDPLLSALGWDTQNIEEVSREYRHKAQDNPVDYALFMFRAPRLFVEAKGLEKDLNDRRWVSQVLGYATVVGVEWCVLTNGDEYRLYNAHAPVDVDQKLFRAVRVSDTSQEEYVLDTLELLSKEKMGDNLLNVLWKAHFVDRHVGRALEDLLRNNDALVRLIRKQAPELTLSDIRESLKRADIRIDFPLVSAASSLSSPQVATTPPQDTGSQAKTKKASSPSGVRLIDLIQSGLIDPPLKLEKEYKGQHLEAEVREDGTIVFDGEPYNSLSLAAAYARMSIIGAPAGRKYPQTNGWTFWKYRNPLNGELKEIDTLRQAHLITSGSGEP